jgi:ATP-dependent Lon protease
METTTQSQSQSQSIDIPDTLPLLPIRDIVVFPHMVVPLFVGRDNSVRAIEAALASHKMVLLVAQKTMDVEAPQPEDIYTVGTVGSIMRMIKVPDGRVKVLIQGITRARIGAFTQTLPFYEVAIQKWEVPASVAISPEVEGLTRAVREQVEKVVEFGKFPVPELLAVIQNLEDPGRLADMIVSNLGCKVDAAQAILEMETPAERLRMVQVLLSKEMEVLSMQHKIHSEARGEMDRTQRDYYLREQLKAIQKELGEEDVRTSDVQRFRAQIEAAKMPEKVAKEAERQVKRLERMHPESAETATVSTYLEWLVDLPWSKSTKDNIDLFVAQKVLNEDHYGMEKVKERILEYLAVLKLKRQKKKERMKGPILCFVGPPGVGKTSMGRSIARAIGREFVRISLGGIRDEAEIRGHRRTYIGALPGRIIQGIKQAGVNNPVFMLDEIDKVGTDFRGDPSSALLEVLDPEQNATFSDHYLGVPFDLSNVMFITTANQMDPIISPLRDRMEVIELSGYTPEEKVSIARNFLIPRQVTEHGVPSDMVRFSNTALHRIVMQYTWEAGVRNLEREIAHVLRKVARKMAEGQGKRYAVAASAIPDYLGVPKFLPEARSEQDEIGVATGLAWTANGGDMMRIEATVMKGKGTLILTGQLGDVMKESASAALSYVRSQEKELGIGPDLFTKNDIHIHVPAGAIPKDGPSAGITMAAAIASMSTLRPLRHDVAMTGEVTLRGRVLPIGGLKEKILAAKRGFMTQIVIPKRNEKDLKDIPPQILQGIQIVFADRMDEVFDTVFREKSARNGKKPAPPKKRK